ncbi:MAG: UDP-N-acetylmuramate--L-alanine ligase [Bacteroidales bacterium]|nr:UDP-N-acetylmuramate--L-alanine ligase [Bacteroidales bacterium]
MDLKLIHKVYLIGIGGIGMSALARYFKSLGKVVAGYDKTTSSITEQLQKEGIFIHFSEQLDELPDGLKPDINDTLVIYTPAIPKSHLGIKALINSNFKLYKRAEILGLITNQYKTIAVAGTHGKTSVSTTTAHLLHQSNIGCLAFLGGISKNYQTNLILPYDINNKGTFAVVEADEFDRSFLQLSPSIALITAIDADHLDIYENKENIVYSFNQFVKKIEPKGTIIYKKGLTLLPENLPENSFSYALSEPADFYAINQKISNIGLYSFDLITPKGIIKNLESGVPGKVNAENSVAAVSLAYIAGLDEDTIRKNLKSFKGVVRRFDFQINSAQLVYVDDYAHHPEELKAFIGSIKEIFPAKKITGIFQPHLYSRTRDFADEFAESLNQLDELILLDIYPAREEPIEGVSSKIIFDNVKIENKELASLENLISTLKKKDIEVLLTMGAGNIDTIKEEIIKLYSSS